MLDHSQPSQSLQASVARDVLTYLGLPVQAPTLRYLNRLIAAYTRTVPWESVSRIIKHSKTPDTADCPRWPEEFWHDAMRYGFGGTCFESSLAFFSLLTWLGYRGYLTVNDMGTTRACHAAIIIVLEQQKYLVDITIPLHIAVRIEPNKVTRRRSYFHNYTIRPVSEHAYQVERSHHPQRVAFTLLDFPVSLGEFREIVKRDYTQAGFFLKSVVIVKVIGDKVWRFFSDHKPYRVESFNRDWKYQILLSPISLVPTLAELFQMPEGMISEALWQIQTPQAFSEERVAMRIQSPVC